MAGLERWPLLIGGGGGGGGGGREGRGGGRRLKGHLCFFRGCNISLFKTACFRVSTARTTIKAYH